VVWAELVETIVLALLPQLDQEVAVVARILMGQPPGLAALVLPAKST